MSTLPGPVGFEEGRVVDNGRKQGGERPQKEGGEELGDDWILKDRLKRRGDFWVKNKIWGHQMGLTCHSFFLYLCYVCCNVCTSSALVKTLMDTPCTITNR